MSQASGALRWLLLWVDAGAQSTTVWEHSRCPAPHKVNSQMGPGKSDWDKIQETATVRVTRLVLDPYLLQHFILLIMFIYF